MIRRVVSFLCALALLVGCLSFAPLTQAKATTAKTLTITFEAATYPNRARSLLKLINQYRKQNGVAELEMAKDLESASLQRAGELFVFFDHTRPDLTDYDTAASAKSLQGATAAAELIASGQSKAEDVFAAWKKTDSAMLLDPDFTHVGIACVYLKESANEYYWELMLEQLPEKNSAKPSDNTDKAGTEKKFSVKIAKGMYERADNSHRRFELRAEDLTLKTRSSAQVVVYLYDRYGVKIGKCNPEDLTYKSSSTSVFTVEANGTVKKKKNGTGTLTIKCAGLDDITCGVTIGTGSSSTTAVTATTIKEAVPEVTLKSYSSYATLSVSLKGASGYVVYRSKTKTGTYTKVDEKQTTQSWAYRVEGDQLKQGYWYKVRAYKNSNGKRVYSEYSEPVKIAP